MSLGPFQATWNLVSTTTPKIENKCLSLTVVKSVCMPVVTSSQDCLKKENSNGIDPKTTELVQNMKMDPPPKKKYKKELVTLTDRKGT